MSRVEGILAAGVADGVFPGAQAAVSVDGQTDGFVVGATCWQEHGKPSAVDAHTRYDLASLTKLVSTAPILWYALDRGLVRIDEPVSRWLPEWSPSASVTWRQLATHTSGLPAWVPLYEGVTNPSEMLAALIAAELEAAPGTVHCYSDLGYMLLGFALERALGAPLDELFEDIVAAPLGMADTGFVRHAQGDVLSGAVAHTEVGYSPGQVHDENAHALGGVAGHAGLFGTASDVLLFSRALLQADGGPRAAWEISPALIRWAFSSVHGDLGPHLLGADTPSGEQSNAGSLVECSPRGATVGHLGFTGTSVWIDRTRCLASVLLTNRVHPTRDAEGIRGVRRAFSDACVDLHRGPRRRIWPVCPALSGPARSRLVRRRRFREVACGAARAAGLLALRARTAGVSVVHKGSVDLVTDADLAAEKLIIDHLVGAFPTHGVLAEESGGDLSDRAHLWIVDPIDGTTNYSHGFPHYCVCIALEVEGQVELGVIYDPVRDEMFCAGRGEGAWLNGRRLQVSGTQSLNASLAVTGFPYDRQTNPDNNADYFGVLLKRARGVRRVGSAGLDLAWIAAGRLDVYWELRLKPWDVSAGLVLVEEAGGRVTDFDGGAFDRACGDVVATCGGGVHEEVVAALSTLRSGSATSDK